MCILSGTLKYTNYWMYIDESMTPHLSLEDLPRSMTTKGASSLSSLTLFSISLCWLFFYWTRGWKGALFSPFPIKKKFFSLFFLLTWGWNQTMWRRLGSSEAQGQVPKELEQSQRENTFHSRFIINNKVCSLIIDRGSCVNVANTTVVGKLGLETSPLSNPYKLSWLRENGEIEVNKQVLINFSIAKLSWQSVVWCCC